MSNIAIEGHIDDIIQTDGFTVHDMMFSIKDVVQCLLLASKTMYDFYLNPHCNCYAITINTTDGWIMSTPMTVNSKFNSSVDRNSPHEKKSRRPNTYIIHDDDHILILLSKGYIMDNFIMKESYHDFLLKEDEPHVMLYASDIESLTLKNPNME